MPSGWTPLRRNSEFQLRLRVAKSPLFLMSCCSPFFFPHQRFWLCLCLFPHSRTSFSSCTSFNSLYFPLCPALPLPKSWWACPLQIPPPAYFLSHPSTLFSHVLSFPLAFPYFVLLFAPVLPMFVSHFPSHILLSMPAPDSSFSVLTCLSLYPSVPYFPVLWILPWIVGFTCIVSVMCFSAPFVLLGFSWKLYLWVTIWFFSWFASCLSNVVNFAFNLLH